MIVSHSNKPQYVDISHAVQDISIQFDFFDTVIKGYDTRYIDTALHTENNTLISINGKNV